MCKFFQTGVKRKCGGGKLLLALESNGRSFWPKEESLALGLRDRSSLVA